jgi:pyruvate,water dikinase
MATVIPVDEFVSDEWYPGFKPGYTHAPWYIDPVQTFSKEDEKNFWFLDFHWPRGLTPMGLIWNEDGYNWASQLAAEQMPLPPGRGITCRLGGTHTYGSDQLGLGRSGGAGAGHAGPRRDRQGRPARPQIPGGGQERGVGVRLRRRPRG